MLSSENDLNENQIKFDSNGKLLNVIIGDCSGESMTPVDHIENKNLHKLNLKCCPLFPKEKSFKCEKEKHKNEVVFRKDKNDKQNELLIHPKYLYDKKAKEASDSVQNQCWYNHCTDDSVCALELANEILENKDGNINPGSYTARLINVTNKNKNLLRKFGGGVKKLLSGIKDKKNEDIDLHDKDKITSINEKLKQIKETSRSKGEILGFSDANGGPMRICAAGLAAKDLEDLENKVRKAVENTHDSEGGFRSALAVATFMYLARIGWSQENIKIYMNIEFRNKNIAPNRGPHSKEYYDYDMDNLDLDRLRKNFVRTNLGDDTAVLALRIVLQAGSFLEASSMAKSFGGDSDTLESIIDAMMGCIAGTPIEYQNEMKNLLKKDPSPEVRKYVETSNQFDEKYGSYYRENAPLSWQFDQTLKVIESLKNEIEKINESEKKVEKQKLLNGLIKSVRKNWNNMLNKEYAYQAKQINMPKENDFTGELHTNALGLYWENRMWRFVLFFALLPIISIILSTILFKLLFFQIALLFFCVVVVDFLICFWRINAFYKDKRQAALEYWHKVYYPVEKKHCETINQHNEATAKYQTKIKNDKLNGLTLNEIEELKSKVKTLENDLLINLEQTYIKNLLQNTESEINIDKTFNLN